MDTNTRQTKRAPVTLKIKFKSATIDQFIERYAVDVSPGGIFIRTKEPLSVGTLMRFEFQLRDATPLITGDGTVVWTRENDPSRPNAAPGMGVRFDRLGDGSQAILDRILAEKARLPSSHAADAPKGFSEGPTRVAPAASGFTGDFLPKHGARSGFGEDRSDITPLPGPVPFHSDAEEYSEEAFEEATKVRSLEELAAQTASDRSAPRKARIPDPGTDSSLVASVLRATKKPATDPKAASGAIASSATKSAAEAKGADGKADDEAKVVVAAAAVDSTSAATAASSTDAKPPADSKSPDSKSSDSKSSDSKSSDAKAPETKSTVESHRGGPTKTSSGSQIKPLPAAADDGPRPVGRPVGSALKTAKPQPTPSLVAPPPPSKAPGAMIVGILAAAVVGAAVWFLFLRETHLESGDDIAGTGGEPSHEDPAHPVGSLGGGRDAGAMVVDAAAIETGTIEIKANVASARVEVVGSGAGPSPYLATLEKGRKYKAKVSAEGFEPVEIEVEAGASAPIVTLTPLPRVLTLTSQPAGALVLLDGTSTGKKTPTDLTLNARQVGRPVRVSLRRAGFAPFNEVVEPDRFAADGKTMVAAVTASLAAANGGGVRPGDGPKTKPDGTTPTDKPDGQAGSKDPAPTTPDSGEPTPAWAKP